MNSSVFVMIVTLALPNGESSIEVKPMQTPEHCQKAAELEIADPYVANVECSELIDGRLELEFQREAPIDRQDAPQVANPRATG